MIDSAFEDLMALAGKVNKSKLRGIDPKDIKDIPVVDIPRPFSIEISPASCAIGKQKDHKRCPTAQGLIQMGFEDVCINRSVGYALLNNVWYRFRPSQARYKQIVGFDPTQAVTKTNKFKPGTYQVLVPQHPLGGTRQGGDDTGNGGHDKGSKDRSPKKPRKLPVRFRDVRGFKGPYSK